MASVVQLLSIVKHKPLIKFTGRRPNVAFDPTKSTTHAWINNTHPSEPIQKDTPTDLPTRWKRIPPTQQETTLINSGGASAVDEVLKNVKI